MQTDMTVGKPMKMLLNFTIPVFVGNVFQQLWFLDGTDHRIYSTYFTEVRCGKNGGNA